MKKTFVLAFLIIIFNVINVSAADYGINLSYSAEQGSVKISGTVSDKENTAAIITIAKDDADIETDTENIIFDAVYTDAFGAIDAEVKIPGEYDSGKYIVDVTVSNQKYSDYFMNMKLSNVSSLLSKLNAAKNSSQLIQVMDENMDELAIDTSVYEDKKTTIAEIIIALRPDSGFSDASGFVKAYNSAEAGARIKNGENVENVLKIYNAALVLDFENKYQTLTAEQKNLLDSLLKPADYKKNTFDVVFGECRALTLLRTAESWRKMKSVFESEKEIINADLTYYNKLKLPDKVFEDLYKIRNNIITIEEFRTQFYDISKKWYNSETTTQTTKPGGSAGGGGGGGGGGGVSSGGSYETKVPASYTQTETTEAVSFTDIVGHWAENDICAMEEKGIINGYGDKTFKPENPVNRAEFTKMIVTAFNVEADGAINFNDVTEISWYYEYIKKAVNGGIVKGVSDESFAPETSITRQDAAVMIMRLLKTQILNTAGQELKFKDSESIADYAKEAVNALSEAEILLGSDGYFNPVKNITRAEAAAIIRRAMERSDG